jgi:hypothetical protein
MTRGVRHNRIGVEPGRDDRDRRGAARLACGGEVLRQRTFWLKMYFLLAAMLYTFTVRRAVVMGSPERANSLVGKLVAIVSVILWSGVCLMGRGIGFY